MIYIHPMERKIGGLPQFITSYIKLSLNFVVGTILKISILINPINIV
jgi:hypothetical protein